MVQTRSREVVVDDEGVDEVRECEVVALAELTDPFQNL